MAVTTLTIAINGNSSYNIVEDTFDLPDKIEENSTCSFTIDDTNGTLSFKKGQQVTVDDTLEGRLFTGEIQTIKRHRGPDDVGTHIYHEISCVNKTKKFDERTSNKVYNGQYAGAIAVDQIKDLATIGLISANYAIDVDDTQADFRAGTLNGTIAANNVEDGNLELAPAGAVTTIIENTTSVFNNGTLTNCTASGNTLAPTATPTIKLVGTESLTNDANAYTYFKIFSSGAINIISGRYLEYDIWIAASSPEIKAGVDIVFTDGTTLRDASQDYRYYDAQNIPPHPNHDLTGFADGKWYHRKFLLDNFSGKTISYVTIAIEGDKGGTYTVYVKNVYETDGAGTNINTFFNSTLNTQKQMQNSGYSNVTISVVNTYDCTTSNRVSPSYNIDQVKILKSSFFSWTEIQPNNTNILLEYSLDGGNSYTTCTQNAALPNLPAGLSLSGKSIQFRQTFQQLTDASPEDKPTLSGMSCTLYPSYNATKSDATVSAATSGQWGAGTLSNTQAPAAILLLLGAVRNWDKADLSGMTIFGGSASGPGPTTVKQHCNLKTLWVEVGNSMEGRSRLDFVGSWADAIVEVDVYIDVTTGKPGIVYRTTGWSNYDANYAYAVECTLTSVSLQRGSNSSAASAGTRTQVATATLAISSASWHRLKVIFVGSNHQVFIDDIQYINATDSTYTGAGNVGLRAANANASAGYQGQFQNFGITVTGLSGTWVSPSQSLTSVGSYLTSVVSWQDVSINNQNTTLLVESTINGGSSWQTVTNGSTIPNLTAGQSLSGISVQFRITLTTVNASSMPQIQSFVARILGAFSSSGTRVSKALSLSSVGVCGSTLVFWNAIQPANTTITVATSLDGTSYTNVSSGGSIAGLNQQPAPTIDSFNLISSANYTNTARTGGTATAGWIWDSANSRLGVSGGTNALLLYAAVSTKDADIYFDLDEADQGGLVWRRSDNSNFYSLEIFDASSSAGATNVMRLFKVVANVKTQIGSDISISLIRGQIVKRVRVLMVGTAISVYFDGSLVRSTTDSSLTGPGLIGFIQVSGIARFYNLRIQPQGDNLSGKQVYTRITLTSTDPTVTPQVTDFTTLVTNPNIQMGALIPTANYVNTYRSDNIADLTKQSDYISNVKPDSSFIFQQRQTTPAPWVLVSSVAPINNDILSGMYVEDGADLYRNRQIITGVKDQLNFNDTKIGDGTSTSWTLKYNVVSISSMTLNGQSVTFGVKGVDSGKNFYYEVGSNSIAADTSQTVLQTTDSLFISGVGEYETGVTRDNTGQFPNTVSQKDYIAQCGLSIPVLTLLSQASAAQNASGTSDDLDVSLCRRIALDINITAHSGTSPTVQFFLERKSADGNYTILWQSSVLSTLTTASQSIGPKCTTKESLGSTVHLRWAIGGSSSPTVTFSASILGKVDPSLAGIGVVEAVEDVSGLNLTIAAAQTLGDSRLQKYGVQGRTLYFTTRRTGLAAGQYLNCFIPEYQMNDAALLITSVGRKQKTYVDVSGNMTQDYMFEVEATEASNLPSWQKAMSDAGIT